MSNHDPQCVCVLGAEGEETYYLCREAGRRFEQAYSDITQCRMLNMMILMTGDTCPIMFPEK